MHDAINVAVIVAYLIIIAVIGLKLSGRQTLGRRLLHR